MKLFSIEPTPSASRFGARCGWVSPVDLNTQKGKFELIGETAPDLGKIMQLLASPE